jgi:hypothetical protein
MKGVIKGTSIEQAHERLIARQIVRLNGGSYEIVSKMNFMLLAGHSYRSIKKQLRKLTEEN